MIKKIIILFIIIAAGIFLLLRFSGKRFSGMAKLSWKANSEKNLAGYNIYYGTSPRTGDCPPGGYPNKINASIQTNFEIKNLIPGKTYYFSVTSYSQSKDESCFSEEMRKKINWMSPQTLRSFF